MATQFDSDALRALRETLLERGAPSSRLGAPVPAGSSPETETLLRRVTPFLELLYLMMVIDGECAESERRLLRGVARTFCGTEVSSLAVDQMLEGFDANKDAEGVEGRLETVASLLSMDRLEAEAAFTLTAAMAAADGDVPVAEHALLGQLAKMLGISERRAHELVEQNPLSARTRPEP